jgi:hypothetical protein
MGLTLRKRDIAELDVPENATRTSDYPIKDKAWAAYLASLDIVDDIAIALEIRARPTLTGDVVELETFMREQGYNPADFES